jgi:integrase
MFPWFGSMPLDELVPQLIEDWRASLPGDARTKNKQMTVLNGIMKRACREYGLKANPVSGVERLREVKKLDLEVLEPEEVWALVRGAATEQDAAIYLTAAYTGMRMGEIRALRWKDVDFPRSLIRIRASYSTPWLTTPKSGKVRTVPLAPDVAIALARLASTRADTGDESLVFPGERRLPRRLRAPPPLQDGPLPLPLPLPLPRRRPRAALPRPAPHLRHPHDRQGRHPAREGVGDHRDVTTTMRYLHYQPPPRGRRPRRRSLRPARANGARPGIGLVPRT